MRILLLLSASLGLFPGPSPSAPARDLPPPADPPAVLELPFPYAATGAWSASSLRLVPDEAVLERLEGEARVRFVGVPVPARGGTDVVDLELRRVRVTAPDSLLVVNGVAVGGRAALEAGFTAWAGSVVGEKDTDVFLSFARTGARGWIERGGGLAHLNPLDAGGFSGATPDAVLMHESDPLLAQVDQRFACEARLAPDSAAVSPPGRTGDRRSSALLECEIAVETDYQYYQLWNDLQSAQDYALSLWSAISVRFEDKVRCRIVLPYLGLYDDPNDPWTAQGGGAGAMLDEFRLAWGGNIPGGADLAHFMSGAGLGGGVAYVDTLCNDYWGFAVSGNINGQVQFPVPTSAWFTWDFMVCAHETGHNFGSWHTHDYCPPLDECAAGPCTAGGVCTQKGTLMSYCHGCPGGMNNILTHFHDFTAGIMASRAAAASCLDRAACELCGCTEPFVTGVVPGVARSYDPDGEWITLFGCNFSDVDVVTVDGVPVTGDDVLLVTDEIMSFVFPRVSRLGAVDLFATNGAGSGTPTSIEVIPPATPRLGVRWWQDQEPGVSQAVGLPLLLGAAPGDILFLCYSSDPSPSTLPGVVDLDIGGGFSDLTVFSTVVMGNRGWEDPSFGLAGAPLFSTWYLQGAALLSSTGVLPLVETDARAIVIVW